MRRRVPRPAWFLMQDYCGGSIQRYRGKHRLPFGNYGRAGWPATAFVIVTARSLSEAHAKAEQHFIGGSP